MMENKKVAYIGVRMKAEPKFSKAEKRAIDRAMKKYDKMAAKYPPTPAITVFNGIFNLGLIAGWAEHDAWMRRRRSKR